MITCTVVNCFPRWHQTLIIKCTSQQNKKAHLSLFPSCSGRQENDLDAGFILLMSLYYFIISFFNQPPLFLMICALFFPSLFILHNNHWVRVIPKSIYSHSYPADVMHHSASNLTFLSNGLHCQLQN